MKQERIAEISRVIDAVKAKGEINHVFLVGCGASSAIFKPYEFFIRHETAQPVSFYTANEFNHAVPGALCEKSLVISCSHSGKTPETVAATELSTKKGALTVSFCCTEAAGSPLEKAANYGIHYEWGDDIPASDGREPTLYYFLFGILNIFRPDAKYGRLQASVHKLDAILPKNLEIWDEPAKNYAASHKRMSNVYLLASGSNYGIAYIYSFCLMMEMQWINSQAIHSGEYFHGGFEMTDFDAPFILIKGTDECRPLDERAEAFATKFSDDVHVIDCAQFDMLDMDKESAAYYSTIVLSAVLRRHAWWLGEFRGHPFTVRRYMWKMEY